MYQSIRADAQSENSFSRKQTLSQIWKRLNLRYVENPQSQYQLSGRGSMSHNNLKL